MDDLHTTRLSLRPYGPGDFDALFAVLADPVAMRYFGPARPLTRREAGDYLAAHERVREHRGFAPWTLRDRTSDEIVGWGGLLVDPFESGFGDEVGYILAPAHWGRGLATELVVAAVRIGFERHDLAEVVAYVRPENAASIRVLEKAGFEPRGHEPRLERDRWSIRRP